MAAYRLTIAYDGSRFSGWAAQPGLRTVQKELEGAIERIVGERVQLTVAGRTDTGVHAWAQVASFRTRTDVPDRLARRLNAVLPKDIAIRDAEQAASDFDARRDARSRTYCYRVLVSPTRDPFEEGRALWWPHPLELPLLQACAEATAGTHDFTAFTPTETEHVRFERDIHRCKWLREDQRSEGGGVWCFWIEADAFMRHMVRVLVGTMLDVAGERMTLDDYQALLRGAAREDGGETAPPHGLYLASIRY